jgi:hypothetical protein
MARVFTLGLIPENTQVNGARIKCMEMVPLTGLMGEGMLETTVKIRKKAMENLFGPMEEVTEENGSMGNSTEKVHILPVWVKRNMENGEKVRG